MSNHDIVRILNEISSLLDIKEVAFKPRAYERAAYSIQNLDEGVDEIYKKGGLKELENVPGVGKSIAEKIEEYIKTGHVKEYEKLKKELPVDISGLMAIEGIGSHTVKKLFEELGIKNTHDLKIAAEKGKIRELEGMGNKSEQKILKAIEFSKKSAGRLTLGTALPMARKIVEALKNIPGVKKAECAGSLRRMQETVGDLDFLVVSDDPEKAMRYFTKMPETQSVKEVGESKSSVRLRIGIDADIRVLSPHSFGAGLQYFTGDKYHNVAVREIAFKKGYKLNEYGLYKNDKLIAGKTEEEIYNILKMKWIPPEIRLNNGEIEAALNNKLPDLIGYSDLQGDCQIHTDWSDGENSIKEMAEAAKKQGLKYIVITDHTKSLGVAGGLDSRQIRQQMEEIDKIQKEVNGIRILKGSEVDIRNDGSLDIDDETLSLLDVVGVSVHSRFNMSEDEMTDRICRAMENPNADIIFHPTGRIIQKRQPYKVDLEKIIQKAKKTKTILEINAFPNRLDIKDEYVKKAIDAGVKVSIDSDAHSIHHLKYLEYGIGQARRGWAEKKDVVNTASCEELKEMLK